MRFGIRIVVLLAVLLTTVVFAGAPGQMAEKQESMEATKLPWPVMWEPEFSQWNPKSRAQVVKIVSDLQKLIESIPIKVPLAQGTIPQIAAIYGGNGIFTGHDGVTYRGEREIALYLKSLIAGHKVSDFGIKIKFVYAKEFTDVLNDPHGLPDDVIHSVYFILSSSFMLDGRIVDPPGSTNCPHIRVCDCIRNK